METVPFTKWPQHAKDWFIKAKSEGKSTSKLIPMMLEKFDLVTSQQSMDHFWTKHRQEAGIPLKEKTVSEWPKEVKEFVIKERKSDTQTKTVVQLLKKRYNLDANEWSIDVVMRNHRKKEAIPKRRGQWSQIGLKK